MYPYPNPFDTHLYVSSLLLTSPHVQELFSFYRPLTSRKELIVRSEPFCVVSCPEDHVLFLLPAALFSEASLSVTLPAQLPSHDCLHSLLGFRNRRQTAFQVPGQNSWIVDKSRRIEICDAGCDPECIVASSNRCRSAWADFLCGVSENA